MKLESARTLIALALFNLIVSAALAANGTITQGSCYLTSEDKKVNFATLTRGLVVQVLGTNAEGRVQVQVPVGDSKVQVAAGWKNAAGVAEGTGWVSKLFIKLDGDASPTPTPSASVAAAPPAKKKFGLLGVETGTETEASTVQPGGEVVGANTAGGITAKVDEKKVTKPAAKRKVRSLLAESAKGKTIILVNIPAQTLWIYKNGQRVMEAGCRVGERDHIDNVRSGDNSKTRVGEHRLTSWHEKYSNSTYGAWTGEWFQFFNKNSGAFGAHTAKFNDRAAQYVHGTYGSGVLDWAVINLTWLIPGSHGCVRVRNGDVTEIRKVAPVGSQVIKVYALRSGTQDAEPTSETWSNIYNYTDVASNGWVDPEKGELIDYKDPSDAVRQ